MFMRKALDKISDSLVLLAHELCETRKEIAMTEHRRSLCLATKHDLCEMERRLLMTSQELNTLLDNRTTQLIKISAEQSKRFDDLVAEVKRLTDLINAGGEITPALVASAEALGVVVEALDAAIPDAVPTPPPA